MKYSGAIRIAIKCIEDEIHRIAIDANMHDLHGADYPHAISCSKRRTELKEAIEILSDIIKREKQENESQTHQIQQQPPTVIQPTSVNP